MPALRRCFGAVGGGGGESGLGLGTAREDRLTIGTASIVLVTEIDHACMRMRCPFQLRDCFAAAERVTEKELFAQFTFHQHGFDRFTSLKSVAPAATGRSGRGWWRS